MTSKLDEADLFAIAPEWFDLDPRQSAMHYGFCCGHGWFEILRDLFVRLKSIAPEGFKVTQVKEKKGTLRVYVNASNKVIDEAIGAAYRKSAETCERCGQPGFEYEDCGWYETICNDCLGMVLAMRSTPQGTRPD